MRNFFRFSALLLFVFTGCRAPLPGQQTPALATLPVTETPLPVPATGTPSQEYTYEACGFAWARQPLPELSRDLQSALKEKIQPLAQGFAEAYGENCLNNEGEVIRFLAMETDFHITLKVKGLEDRQAMGRMIEQVMGVLSEFPVEETPGPQPGYVEISFESPEDVLRFWFRQTDAEAALQNGLHGEELFIALQQK